MTKNGMTEREYEMWKDRNQQTIEGNMAQREDRLQKGHTVKNEIEITELLLGESKKRWITRWGRRIKENGNK